MMHWVRKYIGLPWSPRHDCWAFFVRVQREQFCRDIPLIRTPDYRAETKADLLNNHPHRRAWVEITRDEVREGDGVRMSSATEPGHVGIWVDVDGGLVLHCDEPMGSQATSLIDLGISYREIRFYRFVGVPLCQP